MKISHQNTNFQHNKIGYKMTTKNMKAYYAIRAKKSADKKERERYEKSNQEYLERIEREQQQKR